MEELDIHKSDDRIWLHSPPCGLALSKVFENKQGRFVLEKKMWNKFARIISLKIGSYVMFCFTKGGGDDLTMQFSKV